MSLLSTVLALVLFPLAKRNEEKEGKERIAFLEAEVVRLGEEKDAWARAYEAARDRLDEERERGLQDRAQTRHWRSMADYWQQAYTDLAAPNQYTPEQVAQQRRQLRQQEAAQALAQPQLQNGPMHGQQLQHQYQQAAQLGQQAAQLGQQAQQVGQNLAQQNLWQHPDYHSVGWLCTCVPDRATALGLRPGDVVRVDNVTLARLDLPPRDTDG